MGRDYFESIMIVSLRIAGNDLALIDTRVAPRGIVSYQGPMALVAGVWVPLTHFGSPAVHPVADLTMEAARLLGVAPEAVLLDDTGVLCRGSREDMLADLAEKSALNDRTAARWHLRVSPVAADGWTPADEQYSQRRAIEAARA